MTILSQAQTIRDETAASANTATRVGTCLVDIANAIATPSATISSASISMAGASVTLPDSLSVVAASGGTSVITGTGIGVTEETTPDYLYFSGLDVNHAYKLDFSLSLECDTADLYAQFTACNFAATPLYNAVDIYIPTAARIFSGAFTQTITGTATCALYVELIDRATVTPVSADVQIGNIRMTLVDLGVVV